MNLSYICKLLQSTYFKYIHVYVKTEKEMFGLSVLEGWNHET